jgi:para-nitrobenzyl esterase
MSDLIVETRYGKVQGYEQGAIRVWKGIPFAQPPTGALRFRAPQPPEPWTGVREATAFSPMAPQVPAMGASMVGAPGEAAGDGLHSWWGLHAWLGVRSLV